MPKRKFTDEQMTAFADAYRAGTPVADLAARFGFPSGEAVRCFAGMHRIQRENPNKNRVKKPGRNLEMMRLWREGVPQDEIAARFGVTRGYIRSVMSKSGTRRPNKLTRAQLIELIAEYEAGVSTAVLALKYGRSRGAIVSACNSRMAFRPKNRKVA